MRHIDDERLLAMLLPEGATIRDAMQRIDRGAAEVALAVDDAGHLRGVLTDGDVRRALLSGASLDDPVEPHVSTSPTTVRAGSDRAAVLDLMRARSIAHVPEVDGEGRLTGLHLLRDVVGPATLPNLAVVLAGGRGTRLGSLTRDVPKPMLEVAGRPILERIVLHLVGGGIRRIALSVAYLAERITEHFGDGSDFGCEITYLHEDPDRPLGTGGPLRLVLDEHGLPADPLLVMNGDLLTSFSVSGLLGAHDAAGAALTIGCKDYVHDVPFGVVATDPDSGEVTALEEKPRTTWTVSAGTYVVAPALLDRIPPGELFPITELARGCLERGERVLGWPLEGSWQDIGRPDELRSARGGT
jgi:dTDP-glucose pyrophosphorylase